MHQNFSNCCIRLKRVCKWNKLISECGMNQSQSFHHFMIEWPAAAIESLQRLVESSLHKWYDRGLGIHLITFLQLSGCTYNKYIIWSYCGPMRPSELIATHTWVSAHYKDWGKQLDQISALFDLHFNNLMLWHSAGQILRPLFCSQITVRF